MDQAQIIAEIRRTAEANGGRALGKETFFRETGIKQKARSDDSFPSHNVFRRLGPRGQLIQYCEARPGYEDALAACGKLELEKPTSRGGHQDQAEDFGFVYMIKSGSYYKIGRSNAVGRRERELAIQLPDKATTVHAIRTDDPIGIEAYWHNRFAPRRADGEWFKPGADDIKAFRRRKFM